MATFRQRLARTAPESRREISRYNRRALAVLVTCVSLIAVKSSSKTSVSESIRASNSVCDTFWRGLVPHPLQTYSHDVDMVISYCEGDLRSTVNSVATFQRIDKVFIYSKCGEPNFQDIPANAVLQIVQNVGRCDHHGKY